MYICVLYCFSSIKHFSAFVRFNIEMKKLFSILFAAIVLVSGMHLSVAMHLCGGEIAQVKLSFTHENATCGMCGEEDTTSNYKSIDNESCCKDQMLFYAVDTNFNPSIFNISEPVNQLLQVFYIPESIGIPVFNACSSVNTNVQPPGNYIASAVSLPDICVFRI